MCALFISFLKVKRKSEKKRGNNNNSKFFCGVGLCVFLFPFVVVLINL